jgi:hypothetical protein
MAAFISMGGNCEFGMAQRLCGAEPLDLLRWCNTSIPQILRLLDDRFARIADPSVLSLDLVGGEYVLRNNHYRLAGHTHVRAGEMTPERLMKREVTRLPRQAEMLMQELAEGRRIVVRKVQPQANAREVDAFVAAIAALGSCPVLLVTPGPDRAGTIERVSPRLMRGTIDRFANPADVAADTRAPPWIELCRNAMLVARAPAGADPARLVAAPHITLQAHIQDRGDVMGVSGMVGDPTSERAIEGFLLSVGRMRSDARLACTVFGADGEAMARAPGGHYCGTRGANAPIYGMLVHYAGDAAEAPPIGYQGFFADGSTCGPVALGGRCASGTGSPMVAIRVSVAG